MASASAPDSLELEFEPASQTEELEREIADTVAAVARKAHKRLRSKMLDEGEAEGYLARQRAKTNARQERYRKGLREKVQTLRAALATETARADAAEKRADVAEAKLKELDELLPDDAPGAPGYAGEEPMDG